MDEMLEDLAAAQKEEEDCNANHAGLVAAKKDSSATLTAENETNTDPAG